MDGFGIGLFLLLVYLIAMYLFGTLSEWIRGIKIANWHRKNRSDQDQQMLDLLDERKLFPTKRNVERATQFVITQKTKGEFAARKVVTAWDQEREERSTNRLLWFGGMAILAVSLFNFETVTKNATIVNWQVYLLILSCYAGVGGWFSARKANFRINALNDDLLDRCMQLDRSIRTVRQGLMAANPAFKDYYYRESLSDWERTGLVPDDDR